MATYHSSRHAVRVLPAPSPEEAGVIAAAVAILIDAVNDAGSDRSPAERWRLAGRIEAHGGHVTDRGLTRGWRW